MILTSFFSSRNPLALKRHLTGFVSTLSGTYRGLNLSLYDSVLNSTKGPTDSVPVWGWTNSVMIGSKGLHLTHFISLRIDFEVTDDDLLGQTASSICRVPIATSLNILILLTPK